jgi:hypothetical protein
MGQRAAIEFYLKLKKKATETFKMLKSSYGEECLSRTSVFECHKGFKEGPESLQDDEQKAVLQLPDQKNRRKSFKSVWPKIEF